jgi:hypothetical protein
MATKKGSGTKYPEDISAGNFNATTLQGEIATAGARWTAGATPLSTLSLDEQKAHLGLVVSPEELSATSIAIKASEDIPKPTRVSSLTVETRLLLNWKEIRPPATNGS